MSHLNLVLGLPQNAAMLEELPECFDCILAYSQLSVSGHVALHEPLPILGFKTPLEPVVLPVPQ